DRFVAHSSRDPLHLNTIADFDRSRSAFRNERDWHFDRVLLPAPLVFLPLPLSRRVRIFVTAYVLCVLRINLPNLLNLFVLSPDGSRCQRLGIRSYYEGDANR